MTPDGRPLVVSPVDAVPIGIEGLDLIADPAFLVDPGRRFVYVNDAACRSLGYSRAELLSMGVLDIDPEIGGIRPALIVGAGSGRDRIERIETVHRRRDGTTYPVEVSARYIADGQVLCVARDVSMRRERRQLEEELARREHLYRTLVEHTPDLIVRYDRDHRRLYVNPALARMLGREPSEMLGQGPIDGPDDTGGIELDRKLAVVFASKRPEKYHGAWVDPTGREIYFDVHLTPEVGVDGEVESVLVVLRDVTELHESRRKLYDMAFHDPLTGLPNRALFTDRLSQAIADAAWHRRSVCLMMIDVDRFKSVNDTMGHDAGDELLREVAARLADSVRSYDTVARLGGDEFVVLMPEMRGGIDLGRIADKILRRIEQPYLLTCDEVFVTGSIGVALYPEDGTNGADLLKNADAAMYQAKRSGRNNFQLYSKALTEAASRNLAIEKGLRYAIDRGEFDIHFQPKICLASGAIVGFEALLRWTSSQFGPVAPDEFIPVAEDTGMIVEIGKWVLHQACLAAREWNRADGRVFKVAVNLSGRQFQPRNLVETVADILSATGCRAQWLELEITERLLLDETLGVADAIAALRAMGITIAIDDFGTGFSALGSLAQFPIDILKIDKSFIQRIGNDRRSAELVKAIVLIAECLGLQVVAEGVETAEQASFLKESACQFAQGWLYGRPRPKVAASRLIAEPAGGPT